MSQISHIIPPDQRGYKDASIFVTTEWLAKNLDNPKIRIIDTDFPQQYERAHIPGAVGVVDNYYKTSPDDHTYIQGPDQFADTMMQLGVGDETLVIATDESAGLYSFRLMWALHYYGHTTVKILDGGFPKWIAEGHPVSRSIPKYPKALFTPRINSDIFASKKNLLTAIDDPNTIILDVRSDEERDGSNKRGGPRGGFIPGSIHIEWTNFHTDGDVPVIKNADELKKILADNGITSDKNIIPY